ncbi:MAG: hypothetical protein AMJ73_10075 [candidate division Zixibacteria bacterium SM1_73]|nr:MAG: hypothetical protein AMJ73_10075 [candidate division Zixibacteria bacterium SM1_73]
MATKILEEFLEEVAPEEVGAEVALENPQQADYQLQKIKKINAEMDAVEDFARSQIEAIENWKDGRLKTLQGRYDWLAKPLEIYIRALHRKTEGKQKSLDLPTGKLKLRADQDQYEYDEETLFNWVVDNADYAEKYDLVRVKKFVDKKNIKDFVKTTGEIPEGVIITPAGEPRFYIEFKETKEDATEKDR